MLYPNANSKAVVGVTYNISFKVTDFTGNINIKASTDGGSTYPTTIVSNQSSNDNYNWTVPNTPTSNARIKVEQTSNNAIFIESEIFTIQTGAAIEFLDINTGISDVVTATNDGVKLFRPDETTFWFRYVFRKNGGSDNTLNIKLMQLPMLLAYQLPKVELK